ncbi:hypothetical protein EDC02_6309 [Micromonospora sp. Llam0]|uniref:hypothetical protein n=1 Tax=Micromonospora sp. Llam0 TaxID=2485143 RepID=UPI000F483498|nr:hypothetical protein [Micromonospora sp. Llam0]ROO51432.1 hypothetical protein EDC02_6309 [Micromonospora sp. Llam0]
MTAKPIGPYATEDEALAAPLPRQLAELHATGRVRPGDGVASGTRRAALIAAAVDAGVELGDLDHRVLAWLADWETATVQVVIGLITRAYAAGRAAGPAPLAQDPPPAPATPAPVQPADITAALLGRVSKSVTATR